MSGLRGEKLSESHDLFVRLCRTIVGQQLSGNVARVIYSRFESLFDGKRITPEVVLSIKDQDLRDVGMSWGKVSFIKDLATKVKEKTLHLNKLDEMTDEEVKKELMAVKGIGEWTAEMFLMFTLRRENVFSFGDLGLKKGFEKIYGIKASSSKDIEKVIKNWEPYKTYGSIALWTANDS